MTFATDLADKLDQCRTAVSSSEKGDALQHLAEWLFGQAPGYDIVSTKRFNAFGSEEIDLSLFNDPALSGAHFVESFFLVECKNRADSVPADQVEWFISKLRRRSQSFGVLVTLHGISGNTQGPTHGHHIVAAALQEGIRLVVVEEADLSNLEGPEEITTLLKDKLGGLLTAYDL